MLPSGNGLLGNGTAHCIKQRTQYTSPSALCVVQFARSTAAPLAGWPRLHPLCATVRPLVSGGEQAIFGRVAMPTLAPSAASGAPNPASTAAMRKRWRCCGSAAHNAVSVRLENAGGRHSVRLRNKEA